MFPPLSGETLFKNVYKISINKKLKHHAKQKKTQNQPQTYKLQKRRSEYQKTNSNHAKRRNQTIMKIQKRKIVHSLSFIPVSGEYNSLPSETIPDDTLTLKEILANHTKGALLQRKNQLELFDEDFDLPDIKTLDLVDQQELKELHYTDFQEKQKIYAKDTETHKAKAKEKSDKINALLDLHEKAKSDTDEPKT